MAATAVVSARAPVPGIPDASTISLRGVLTRDQAPGLRRQLLEALEESDEGRMVLSLAEVEQMDTAGAAVLAEVIKRAGQRDVSVLLCSPSPAVRNVFELAGFPEVLSRCCADPAETRERLLA